MQKTTAVSRTGINVDRFVYTVMLPSKAGNVTEINKYYRNVQNNTISHN